MNPYGVDRYLGLPHYLPMLPVDGRHRSS